VGTSTDQPAALPGVRACSRRALTAAAFAAGAGLVLAPGAVFAADDAIATAASAKEASTAVDSVDVTAGRNRETASAKYTAPLVDTPQTITVVPKAVIEAQNLLTLRDILSTVPGITFGAGEAGGGYGDSINLRGYSASSDITVDGVRDSAQYSRSDPFNIEQIEVTNGANGVIAGSGSVGGSVNIVSKAPLAHDVIVGSAGVGDNSYGRVALDANMVLGDNVAVRLNLMAHNNDAPGRDIETFQRWGVAPSIEYGLGTATRATLSYFHQTDNNIPQYGVPFFNGRPVPGVNPSSYYGYRNIDEQNTDADAGTLKLEHDFGNGWNIRNLTRYQLVTQYAQVDAPERIFCLANGQKPVGYAQTVNSAGLITANSTTGYQPCVPGTDPNPGFYQPSGNHGTTRNSRNTETYNETDLVGTFHTGFIEHSFTFGGSYIRETYRLDGGNVLRNADGSSPVLLPMNIATPDNFYTGPVNYIRATIAYGARNNGSLYYFETAKLGRNFELNGGIRYDNNEGSNRTDTYTAVPTPGQVLGTKTIGTTFHNADNLFSYRIGAVYKPTSDAAIYLAYGNTQTPSQSAVNGACTAATCNLDPEKAKNLELGAKWNDQAVALTAAVFRNERSNYKVVDPNNIANPSGYQTLDGSSRVDGVALGASGKVTDRLAVFANYTYLDSEVLHSVSKAVAATVGDFTQGDPLTQTPKNSFSLYSSYDISRKLQIGYGVTYQGAFYLSQHTSLCSLALVSVTSPVTGIITTNVCPSTAIQVRSTLPLIKSADYWVSRLNITYKIDDRTDARLNVNNLFNREYYTRIRNNGWATPGDTCNVTLTINRRF
jgi:catecholate siderophore receptor